MKSQHSMEEGGKWIKAMLTSLNPSHNSGNTFNISSPNLSRNPYSLPLFQVTSSLMHYALGSIAEQTLSVHKGNPNQIMNSDKPLVQKDNKFYPQNPENKYISIGTPLIIVDVWAAKTHCICSRIVLVGMRVPSVVEEI